MGVIDYGDANLGNLIIKDTIIESNYGDAITIHSNSNVSLSRLAIKGNHGNGLNVLSDRSAGAIVDISDSVITQNSGNAISSSGNGTTINCVGNVITSNETAAINVQMSGLVRISNNDIYNNESFIISTDETGEVETANNNRSGGNGSGAPTGSILIQ